MTLINLLLIQFILVVIIDDSGFIDSVKRGISKLLTKGKIITDNFELKPFSCSYCMQVWCGLIYLLIIGQFTIPYIAFNFLLAAMVPVTKDLVNLFRDLFIKLIDKIYTLLYNE